MGQRSREVRRMSQSRSMSALEVGCNYAAGFLIAWVLSYFVLPYWGFEQSASASLAVTIIYTVVSVGRSYVCRRIFNLLATRQA